MVTTKAEHEVITLYEFAKCSRSQMLFKIVVLRYFPIFKRNHLCWSLFFIKERPQHRDLPVNIVKFLEQLFYRLPVAAFGCNNQLQVFRETTTSKFQGQHAAQFGFCRYECLCPATKADIYRRCFPRNSAKF